jgi:hypothetical protein
MMNSRPDLGWIDVPERVIEATKSCVASASCSRWPRSQSCPGAEVGRLKRSHENPTDLISHVIGCFAAQEADSPVNPASGLIQHYSADLRVT